MGKIVRYITTDGSAFVIAGDKLSTKLQLLLLRHSAGL